MNSFIFSIKKIQNIFILFSCLIFSEFIFSQTENISGEWVIQVGNGTINSVRINQTDENVVFWLKINNKIITYKGKIENEILNVSRDVENRYSTSEKRDCHNLIISQQEQYPEYKLSFKLELKNKKLEGTYTTPRKISCENGINITLATPITAVLTPVNYIYWISENKILKAPTNNPDNVTTLVESTKTITDIALDKEAKRIYWAEGKHIYSINQKGKSKQNVTTATEEVFYPHSLIVQNKSSKLVWVEDRKIMSTQLNHDNRTELLEEQGSPRSLVIDSINNKMYWLMDHSDKIRRANLDGSNAEDFAVDADATYLAIDAMEGYLYWATHIKIRRVSIKSPQAIEDIVTGNLFPRDIFIDKTFNKIYWAESPSSNAIWRSNLDGKRKEHFIRTDRVRDIVLGPVGPSSYDAVKIKGSLLIKEAAAGKSLLQELIKNDVYYQVLLSEYARENSDFNLTDTKLILIWGENFPRRLHRGNNIVFNSLDPKIKYQEYDTWNYKLDDQQKERYSNHPLWLTKNSGIKNQTWDVTWKKVKDSLGTQKLDSIKSLNHMLVLATPKDGVVPGLKPFTMNDAEAEWFLNVGNTVASMRFLRKLPNGEEETIHNIYAGDPFFIEIKTSQNIGRNALDLSFFIDNQPLQIGGGQLDAKKYANNNKTYRTRSITLQEFLENGGSLQVGIRGNIQSVCKIGSIFKAVVSNSSLFNNGIPPSASSPLVNYVSSIWHRALGEAIVLSNLNILEEGWERSINKPVETFTSMDITAIPSGGITSSCSVTLGDYAAMILLRRYFVKHMTTYYESLNKHRDDPIFQYGFWEMMAPQMVDENFPLGNIEVTDDEIALKNAFSKAYILENYNSPEQAEVWIKAAKKDGFLKYLNSVKNSLDTSKNIDDKEVKKLLDLTGFGFKSMISMVTSDLQKKKFPTQSEFACDVVSHIWEPDYVGRSSVKTMNNTAQHCRANEDLQEAGTDVLLASASLLVFPIGAYATYGKIAAAVYGAALGSGEIIRDNIKFSGEDEELGFSGGSFALLGTERYKMAKLKVTPTWARMLSYFGGGLGVAGDAFDILKYVGKVDMASVYAKLPSMLNEIDSKGALDAYQSMSQNNKARFLLLLGEAEELKRLPANQLTDAQKRLMMAAEQFSEELDIASKAKNAVDEVSEAVKDLTEGLPSHLKNKTPIIKDDALPGSSVRLEYKLDANGFVSNIQIRAGKAATAQHIAEHVPALVKMKEYEGVASNSSKLYGKIRHWYRRVFAGEPPIGSPAWESMQEVKKLNYIIESRINSIISGAGDIDLSNITREIQDLSNQLNKHQKGFEEFLTNPQLGRGYVAGDNNVSNAKQSLEQIKKRMIKETSKALQRNNDVLTVRAERIQKSLDFLDKSPQREKLYEAVLSKAIKEGQDEIATRFLVNLSHFDALTSQQLLTMRKFMEATGDAESLTLILQRGIPRHIPELVDYNKKIFKDVMNFLKRHKDNPKLLKGASDYIQIMGKEGSPAIGKFKMLTERFNVVNLQVVFDVISKFKSNTGIRKIVANLSSSSQNSIIGALGHLTAIEDALVRLKNIDIDQLVFEFPMANKHEKNFRFIDIVIVDKLKNVINIIEVKEYAVLENLLNNPTIRGQFAKDLLITHLKGLTLGKDVKWMISKQVLNGATDAATIAAKKKVLMEDFMKVFTDNDKLIKGTLCEIDEGLERLKGELESNFESLFLFYPKVEIMGN